MQGATERARIEHRNRLTVALQAAWWSRARRLPRKVPDAPRRGPAQTPEQQLALWRAAFPG